VQSSLAAERNTYVRAVHHTSRVQVAALS